MSLKASANYEYVSTFDLICKKMRHCCDDVDDMSTTPYMEQCETMHNTISSPYSMKNRNWTDPLCLGKIVQKLIQSAVKVIFTLVQSVIITDLHK